MLELALRAEELSSIGLDFHHIGVACRDLDTEERVFALLGYRRESPDFTDPIQGIEGRFLVGPGPRLELLRNAPESARLTSWLQKGVKFYHLAFETAQIEEARDRLVSAGAKQVVAPVPAVAFDGRRIAFVMLPDHSLIELIESAPKES